MTPRRILSLATLAGALVLAGGCGGGGGGGGGEDDLATQAAQAEALMDRIEALPTTATTEQAFTTQLEQLRVEVQQEIEDVASADVPAELRPAQEGLASRLRELRTQLGRVAAIAARGDLESAGKVLADNRSVAAVRAAAADVQAGG